MVATKNILPVNYWENEFENGWKNGTKPNKHLLHFLGRCNPGSKILDVGCGDGRHLVLMAQQGYHMTGLELTKNGISTTKAKLKEKKLVADIIQGTFHTLPFNDYTFDHVISVQALHYNDWDGAQRSFQEISRMLPPNGLFFFRARSDKGHWRPTDEKLADNGITRKEIRGGEFQVIVHDYTLAELKELANQNNFEIVSAIDEDEDNRPGQWNTIFKKI